MYFLISRINLSPSIRARPMTDPWYEVMNSFIQGFKYDTIFLTKSNRKMVLNPVRCLCLSQARAWISNAIFCSFFFCVQWFEVRGDVYFVNIGRIVDHHYLNFFQNWTRDLVKIFNKFFKLVEWYPHYQMLISKRKLITNHQ